MARKHVFQMTQDEKSYLYRKVAKLRFNNYTTHGVTRMEDRDIESEDITKTLSDYRIVEYKMDEFGKQSVLIQSKEKIKGNFVNIVVGLNNNVIITCYKNPIRDFHVDSSLYNARLDIRNLMKSDTKLRSGYFSNKRKYARG